MPRFIRARFLLPMSDALGRDRRIEDGYALWEGDALLEVGAYSDAIGARLIRDHGAALEVVEPTRVARGVTDTAALVRHEGVLLPGFVKAHGHDHEPPIIGLVKDVALTGWLDGVVNPFTGFMKREQQRLEDLLGRTPQSVSYLKARVDDLYYGITTSMVHHCNHSKYFADDLVAAAETAGTRMIVAVGGQDRHYADDLLDTVDGALERLDGYRARHGHKTRVTIIPGPDQLFSNGPEMMSALKDWSRRNGTLLHFHSSEEKRTTAWFRETYGMTPIAYAHGLGILDSRTVVAHQVHSTEEDLQILAETGTRIVHNPLANTILGSGMPPVVDMLERGIPVAISTDGSGSADNQNILAAARLASQYQKARYSRADYLPAQQALEMITVEAARILDIPAGSLEVGRPADLVLVATDTPNMTPTRVTNVVENLVWASDGSEVRVVVAGGEVVRQGSAFHTLDLARILEDVSTLSAEFDAYRLTAPEVRGTGANA
ncbi:MAG: hypothetical protein EP329_19740 [Deltaproteobacteria bacterium]|nr:MAG: hypothetical protein EP329_19740 [Deltaproteobacteria bacterium]